VKTLVVVLSAAVIAGLGVYALFVWRSAFRVVGNSIQMDLDTFVWLLTALTLASAGMTLAVRAALVRADRDLHARLDALEKQRTA
jgi:hypothetical protein